MHIKSTGVGIKNGKSPTIFAPFQMDEMNSKWATIVQCMLDVCVDLACGMYARYMRAELRAMVFPAFRKQKKKELNQQQTTLQQKCHNSNNSFTWKTLRLRWMSSGISIAFFTLAFGRAGIINELMSRVYARVWRWLIFKSDLKVSFSLSLHFSALSRHKLFVYRSSLLLPVDYVVDSSHL